MKTRYDEWGAPALYQANLPAAKLEGPLKLGIFEEKWIASGKPTERWKCGRSPFPLQVNQCKSYLMDHGFHSYGCPMSGRFGSVRKWSTLPF